MNVFEKLKDYRKINFNIYVDKGAISHTVEDGYNEYTILARNIEFTNNKNAHKPMPRDYETANMNINIFINNGDDYKSLEVITSPYIFSLSVEIIRDIAPIYTFGSPNSNYYSRGMRSNKITLRTTVNIEESTLMFKLNANGMRVHANSLSHSIIGTPFTTIVDNDTTLNLNSTLRGVLSYE